MAVTRQAIPDPVRRISFLQGLSKHLNTDDRGRTSLQSLMVEERRNAVMELFDGYNHKNVARQLNITLSIVYDDVAACYARRKLPGEGEQPMH